MPQKTMLKANGLHNDPNQLTISDGSLNIAENVVINRNDVIEPRRGFNKYGLFGTSGDLAKQLLVYKDRILIHYDSKLAFNANPHNNTVLGDFQDFSGSFTELDSGRRIRSIESNKNLFFTTNDGIKKISASTAADFTTAANYIIDAGTAKALDVTGSLNSNVDGFFPPNSKVAYRVVWSYKDVNDNLIAGSPSSRLVMTNYSVSNANNDLEFAIPQGITTNYFYQVYRSAVITATGNLTLNDIDPGDELQLVIEDFPTTVQLTAGLITVTDLAPEDFRTGGLPLYTNPQSGSGITQANEPPPKAKDLTLYRNAVFYANTETKASTTVSLLGVDAMTSGVSSITIDDTVNTPQTYTFVGTKEQTNLDFTVGFVSAIPSSLNGTYFLMNSASDKRKYYVWFDTTKTTQTVDFTNYIGTIPTDLKQKIFVLHTKDTERKYYVWYDSTGTDIDPGTDPINNLSTYAGIRVDISSGITTTAQVATATSSEIITNDINNDFDVSVLGSTITIETESFDTTVDTITENILKGFSFVFTTPTNLDPGVLGNSDVTGRSGIRVNISRGVTTRATLAAVLADSIIAQDTAGDFTVSYTTGNTDIDITNTNNGATTDTINSTITPVPVGFVITTTTQGTGENYLLKQVLLSAAVSPAQQIDETARSLVNVINKNSASSVYAYYVSGPTDLPGQIFFQVKDIGTNQFNITANDATMGNLFNPALPPAANASPVSGKSEIKPNRLYYSKLQQPEAVPLLNYVDIGPQDKEISRILALRESLFILKEDGVYRLTGVNGNYNVNLFDGSTKIIAPDTAVVLNNQIYCLSNQGIVAISDTGISVLSKPLDFTFKTLTSSNFNFRFTSFGVAYETDRSYLLWMPGNRNDNVATFAFRYNTQTNSYTTFDIAKTCGIINPGDDKMYLGPDDVNFIERERKLFNRTDYADRDFDLIIPANSVNNSILGLSSATDVTIGDALLQTQYVTVNQFNQLLAKLDLDPAVQHNYASLLEMLPGNNIISKISALADKLDLDPGVNQNDFATAIASYSGIASSVTFGAVTTITKINHGIQTGRIITVTSSTGVSPSLVGTYVATRIDNDNFTIAVTTTIGGTCDWSANVTNFQEAQGAFNTIINKLNLDTSVIFNNYLLSSGTTEFEVLVIGKTSNSNDVNLQFTIKFLEGPVTVYKAIVSRTDYAPETVGDVSMVKQFSESTIIFEDTGFSRATVGFKTDLSPGFETIDFDKSGKGDFGYFTFSQHNWGGLGSGVPLRTYIPRQKQRCRYMQIQLIHNSAREKYSLFGISYTFRVISERGYRS